MCLIISSLSPPNSFKTLPLPTLSSTSCLLFIAYWLQLVLSLSHGCRAIHCWVGILTGHISEGNRLSWPQESFTVKAPQVGMDLCELLSHLFWIFYGLDLCRSCAGNCNLCKFVIAMTQCIWKTLFHSCFPGNLALTLFLCLLPQCALHHVGQKCDVGVSSRCKYLTINSSPAFWLALCINWFGSFPYEIKYAHITMAQYFLSVFILETYPWVVHEKKLQLYSQ